MRDRERRVLEEKLAQAILGRQVTKPEAAQTLGVTRRSIDRYLGRFQEAGPEGLYDRRHSNHRKLDEAAEPNAVWQLDIQGKVRFPLNGGQFGVLLDHLSPLVMEPELPLQASDLLFSFLRDHG